MGTIEKLIMILCKRHKEVTPPVHHSEGKTLRNPGDYMVSDGIQCHDLKTGNDEEMFYDYNCKLEKSCTYRLINHCLPTPPATNNNQPT